ncbi:nitroreductase family protein [Cohnella faecalis]|uniref:hypothetical protein n=1 Tax=Cohnella faecalis TaxID=2315694 RepID=UPI002D792069|nr:hypothetical protein [Cohnella faecalis]
MLEAAVWAPNHHQTEPWKFRRHDRRRPQTLGRAYAEIASGHSPNFRSRRGRNCIREKRRKRIALRS